MADAVPLAGDPSGITTVRDLEVTPLAVRSSAIATSGATRQARPQHVTPNGTLSRNSQPMHHGFSVISGKHPLSAIVHAPLFRDLSTSELKEMSGAGQERIFSHNQSLFGEGDPLRSISIITSGHAKIVRHSTAGKLMILHVCGPGDALDGLGCSSGNTHSVEARAVRHCRVFSWEVGQFESFSRRFPTLRFNSMRLLLGRLRTLEGRVHELATDRVPQRLAKVLIRLIVHAQGSARSALVDLTGEDLAQMAGTTQFTVSRLLCDWASQRIIQPERTAILVENLPGLLGIAMQVGCADESASRRPLLRAERTEQSKLESVAG